MVHVCVEIRQSASPLGLYINTLLYSPTFCYNYTCVRINFSPCLNNMPCRRHNKSTLVTNPTTQAGALKCYSRKKGQSARPHELIQKITSISKMDCCRVSCMTFTPKSALLLSNWEDYMKMAGKYLYSREECQS